MTRLAQLIILFLFVGLIQGCTPASEPDTAVSEAPELSMPDDEEEDGPPFKVECKANFERLGEYKISNDNYNIYYSGKGWDPARTACTWTWAEIINNEFPGDSGVTFFKVHLLDLEKFTLPGDGSEYGRDSIKKYVIATYSRNLNGGKESFRYDPFNTGKYPAPR